MEENLQIAQKLHNILQNSFETETKFESIIKECKEKKRKYKDPDFYPNTSFIENDKKILKDYKWNRIEEQYSSDLFENISPQNIHPGSLGDYNFIASIIQISNNIDIIKSLFHPKSSLECGCVLIYFNYLGEKIPIIIDTQVPYKENNEPLFIHPKTENDSCCFALIEKAFAKACGGFSSIISVTSHFSLHVLTGFYSSCFSNIIDIIPSKSLEEEEERQNNKNVINSLFVILSDLLERKAFIGTSIDSEKEDNLGLVSKHPYSIIDVKKSENKYFVKLKNPIGICEPLLSEKITKKVKNGLKYSDEDGSFWMHLERYLRHFNQINYSLEKEKTWKGENVFGKIDGYLDGRSPCNDRKVGCIPQWSIKFSKRTIVRLTFNASGPESCHSIYICKNHGFKVYSLHSDDEMVRSISCSMVNGIEYVVEDFEEPYTFFFTRTEKRDYPCYFRILIESPDTEFSIKKFDDDFIRENWYCFSDTRIFNQKDFWNINGSFPLSTSSQWYIRFPNLLKNKDDELRFRIFKNINEGPLCLFFARTSEKIGYFPDGDQYIIGANSDYEEISVPVCFKNFHRYNDVFKYKETDSADYVFTFYRSKESNISNFRFSVLCQSEFEIGLMPEPDPINNCGYTLRRNYLYNDLPYYKTYDFIDQYLLVFKEEHTTLFIEFLSDVPSSEYQIILEEKPKNNLMIKTYDLIKHQFFVRENCLHDQVYCKIDRIYDPYLLYFKCDSTNEKNDFTLNIFGTKNFQMYRLTKNGCAVGVPKYDKTIHEKNKQMIDFPGVEFIEQPNNFIPNKKEQTTYTQALNNEDSYYYYEYSYDYNEENFQYQDPLNNDLVFSKNNELKENENLIIDEKQNQKTNNQSDNNQYSYYYYSEYTNEQEKNPQSQEVQISLNEKDINSQEIPDFTEGRTIEDVDQNEESPEEEEEFINNDEIEYNNKDNEESNQNESERRLIDEAKVYLFNHSINYLNLFLISRSGKKQILALIGFAILILKPTAFSRKITREHKILFKHIFKISLSNNTIGIQYVRKKYRSQLLFQTDNFSLLISELICNIYRTLNQFEIDRISFENISFPEILPKRTSNSISLRLNSKSSLKKTYILNEYSKLFSKVLFSHSNSFFLAKVKKMKKLFRTLFPCISLDENINQIDIVDPKIIFPFLLKYYKCFNNIKHLKVKGDDSSYFYQFIDKMKNINSISFHDYKIRRIDSILNLIENRKIESIGFDSSLDEKTFHKFIESESFNNLKYFRASNVLGINFASCINYFGNLLIISLTFCNLDISDVFKALESNPIDNLQELDLSGNVSNVQNELNYSIPPKLQTLFSDNVKWKINQLNYFISACAKSNLKTLSINSIEFIDDSYKQKNNWEFVFSNLPIKFNTINSLYWNSNEINHDFITFLINSQSLTNLSFVSCNCSNLNEIRRLLNYHMKVKHINIQKITSFDSNQFKEFLREIPNMKYLKQLDLSNNEFDDKCLEILAEALLHSNLSSIAFDNSNIKSFTDLLDFYRKLKAELQTPINISYPIADIQQLGLNQNEITLINKNLAKLKKPLSMREKCIVNPFQEVFYLRQNDNFPQFWTSKNDQIQNNMNKIESSNKNFLQPDEDKKITNQNNEEGKNSKNKLNGDELVQSNNVLVNSENSENDYYSYSYSEVTGINQTQSPIFCNKHSINTVIFPLSFDDSKNIPNPNDESRSDGIPKSSDIINNKNMPNISKPSGENRTKRVHKVSGSNRNSNVPKSSDTDNTMAKPSNSNNIPQSSEVNRSNKVLKSSDANRSNDKKIHWVSNPNTHIPNFSNSNANNPKSSEGNRNSIVRGSSESKRENNKNIYRPSEGNRSHRVLKSSDANRSNDKNIPNNFNPDINIPNSSESNSKSNIKSQRFLKSSETNRESNKNIPQITKTSNTTKRIIMPEKKEILISSNTRKNDLNEFDSSILNVEKNDQSFIDDNPYFQYVNRISNPNFQKSKTYKNCDENYFSNGYE